MAHVSSPSSAQASGIPAQPRPTTTRNSGGTFSRTRPPRNTLHGPPLVPYLGPHRPRPNGIWFYYNTHGGVWDQYVPNPIRYMATGGEGHFIPQEMAFPVQMGFMPMRVAAPPPPPMPILFQDTFAGQIVNQIDYYFSDDNLAKDTHLRSKMDECGWVPITLIASFPRVKQLTIDIPLILESLKSSTIVQVQGNKVRRRDVWRKWLLG